MKLSTVMTGLGCLFLASVGFAQQVHSATTQDAQLQMAREGCQKPIGMLPSPKKLMCILHATGLKQDEVKPKAVALIFNVCQGRVTKTDTAGIIPKRYKTLGECLNDPNAITLINKELQAHQFQPIDQKTIQNNLKNIDAVKITPTTQQVSGAPKS